MIKNGLIKGLQHIGIPTDKIDLSVNFYKSLGFHLIMETINEETNEKVVFLELNALVLELYESKKNALMDGAINHIALDVDSIGVLYESIIKVGYEVVTDGIQFLPFGNKGILFFIINGPNCEKIEFCKKIK